MAVRRLTEVDRDAMERLLRQDPVQNLFLLGVLEAQPVHSAHWYGVADAGAPRALIALFPGRLVVPWCPDVADAVALARRIPASAHARMIVGPRDACDAIWSVWGTKAAPACHFDQRLYTCAKPSSEPQDTGVRLATLADQTEVMRNARAMEIEDLGRDPATEDPGSFANSTVDRIHDGRTWVSGPLGSIVFQVSVGTRSDHGCQVGGTWVPIEQRGRGVATRAMRTVTARLLLQHPIVTLHVNEANTPAVSAYERAGYHRGAAYRLIRID